MSQYVSINRDATNGAAVFIRFGDNHAWGDHRLTLGFDRHIDVTIKNTRPDSRLIPGVRTTDYEFKIVSNWVHLSCEYDPTDPGGATYNISMTETMYRDANSRVVIAVPLHVAIKLHQGLIIAMGLTTCEKNYTERIAAINREESDDDTVADNDNSNHIPENNLYTQ